ncbi:hypothetical protein Mkiyose1088_51600 [Mycobacterium kiyosense]|uniref:HTH iclR-type domain-containing protein n=1 Tax=Mycobacterium kiyosense TaxID=2871094 RepID=A0A9P3UZ03_9MYCO|nr:helix-turn-helix domain-containing protein [Mycobacterium kiyosense]BDE16962.1 hypothetical protein MKCMC460_58220 [Mycobacterium sp. 20KCMC460]BDB45506.1 hypothetical protein IWGMT90018_59520 [Mycobacterium kiyosense]GLB83521.1 hypothetical protein SRL2020028_27770 [Mycobacterium kiyosense]GLC21348.1 hypothetical protein SRL2020472_39190 [Mycobacterium kiyosense]GLD03294.1 hypothetical protein Mkiyose1088_51600 [Mycobacterium kiyosense]
MSGIIPRLYSPVTGPAPAVTGGTAGTDCPGLVAEPADKSPGRGVLAGAFTLLEALAQADDGLGLTALARVSGLAKTSAHRLAEQLVELGAAQRVGQRYYVGPRLGRIGQHWQPDPELRKIAHAPVHDLAVSSACEMSALVVLYGDRLRVIAATARRGCTFYPDALDRETVARTAAGRILYAVRPGDPPPPSCWKSHEWQQLREQLLDVRATVSDLQDTMPGTCSVSAPVRNRHGECLGAVFALEYAAGPSPKLGELVLRTVRRIEAALP